MLIMLQIIFIAGYILLFRQASSHFDRSDHWSWSKEGLQVPLDLDIIYQDLGSLPFPRSRKATEYKDEFANSVVDPIYEAEIQQWLDQFNKRFQRTRHEAALLSWQYNTNITQSNAKLVADFGVRRSGWIKPWKTQAAQIDLTRLSPLVRRQISFIRRGSRFEDPEKTRQIIDVHSKLQELYNTGKVCVANGTCFSGEPDLARFMQTNTDYDQLLWAWKAWRDAVGPTMKPLYVQFVDLLNYEAKFGGHKDMGSLWRLELETHDLEKEVDDLFAKVKPLYRQLHAYVRLNLVQMYGSDKVPPDGPIPAHLLGNMWAQQWDPLYPYILPFPEHIIPDVTKEMVRQKVTPIQMFGLAEDFFTSIGLEPMTKEFWSRSMFERPTDDRPVACHGSATNFYDGVDFRIRMCTEVTERDLYTVHHEMGHIEYFMAYRSQPILFQDGANSAFHEAIGDTVQYSVLTPEHLHQIHLIPAIPQTYKVDINFLLKQALLKLPLLPFSLALEKWRWDVFRGIIKPDNYNSGWWNYMEEYMGIVPPIQRSEHDFDAGSKYHIPDNTPYIRYFLSAIMQVQFHEALCRAKHGGTLREPLHRCDIYKSMKAGKIFKSMLSIGTSKRWQDSMFAITGQNYVLADSLLRYYDPLYNWLIRENRRIGATDGWESKDQYGLYDT